MDVLVTGADTVVGRTIAQAYHAAGHRLVVTGTHRDELESVARELGADAVICDCADPTSLADAQTRFPHHLDTVVIVPAQNENPRAATLADAAAAWRQAFDGTVIAAVLTVQTVAEHLRSGGSIVCVLPGQDSRSESVDTAAAAAKAALSSWTTSQADHFGTRGITINTVAAGRTRQPGYDGLTEAPPAAAGESARLTVFLSPPAARHITGQTLHVGRGAAISYS